MLPSVNSVVIYFMLVYNALALSIYIFCIKRCIVYVYGGDS